MRVGVAGGGIAGRLLAWRAAAAGAEVELFDSGENQRCSGAAAGMLSPRAELVSAAPGICELGLESLPIWGRWLDGLGASGALSLNGSLLVAHRRDRAELERVRAAIEERCGDGAKLRELDRKGIEEIEPALGHVRHGYLVPDEGCLDADLVMEALRAGCDGAGVSWSDGEQAEGVGGGTIRVGGKDRSYDWACDCRGLGAAGDLPLRAVRGEIVHLQSDEVELRRPVRIAHPRHLLYAVPRGEGRLLVGATEVETSDGGAPTVRSALELLGAAYGLHPALAEARVADVRVGLRPALPDNEPICEASEGKVSINGMYRHGFLVAPALVERAIGEMGIG